MIAYMEGKILKVNQDGIILLAGHIGYEILLPVFVMEKVTSQLSGIDKVVARLSGMTEDAPQLLEMKTQTVKLSEPQISLYIYYYQTDRQPKPILIGFNSEDEKDFFQVFISVDAIGPLKAVKAIEKPISQIATAIEQQDIDFLASLKGIGKRTAQKIVAALHGKVSRFISESIVDSELNTGNSTSDSENPHRDSVSAAPPLESSKSILSLSMQKISQQVVDVLVEQLGYTGAIARKMVTMAMEKNPSISTPEQLFEAVLHRKL